MRNLDDGNKYEEGDKRLQLLNELFNDLSKVRTESLQILHQAFKNASSQAPSENIKLAEKKGLKDDVQFAEFVSKNLWQTRRERGWDWNANVFEYIAEVYKPYLGQGLVQSDIKTHDPKLYARLHQELAKLTKAEKEKVLNDLQLPKVIGEGKLKFISDPIQLIGETYMLSHEKTRSKKRREASREP